MTQKCSNRIYPTLVKMYNFTKSVEDILTICAKSYRSFSNHWYLRYMDVGRIFSREGPL